MSHSQCGFLPPVTAGLESIVEILAGFDSFSGALLVGWAVGAILMKNGRELVTLL